MAVEWLGCSDVLLPAGRGREDAWIVVSALAPATKQLHFLVALRRASRRRPDAVRAALRENEALTQRTLASPGVVMV